MTGYWVNFREKGSDPSVGGFVTALTDDERDYWLGYFVERDFKVTIEPR